MTEPLNSLYQERKLIYSIVMTVARPEKEKIYHHSTKVIIKDLFCLKQKLPYLDFE